MNRFFSWLALLATVPLIGYLASSGVWGPSWRSTTVGPRHDGGTGGGVPAFILLFDELSYEVLTEGGANSPDAASFPAFAALAGDSSWFTNATTHDAFTDRVIPALLGGRLKPDPGRPSLASALSKAGYAVNVIESYRHPNPILWPDGGSSSDLTLYARHGSNQDTSLLTTLRILGESVFDQLSLIPNTAKRVLVRWVGERSDSHRSSLPEFEFLLSSIGKDSRLGQMWFWHCSFPHFPFSYTAEGVWKPSEHDVLPPDGRDHPEAWARYRVQVQLVDRLLGRFVRQLKQLDLYDRCVLVVTSDHGIRTWGSREPAGYPRIRGGMTPRIPLAIRGPGLVPGGHDLDYQPVDLAPTVLDLLGVPFKASEFEGVSLKAASRPVRRKEFSGEHGDRYVLDPSRQVWDKDTK